MTLEVSRRSTPWALGAGVLVGLLVFLFNLPFAQNTLFFDDAADYIRAADAGFLATWLNTNSASPVELVHLRQEEAFRAHPWDYLYMHGDNTALRHFHGPLSYLAVHLVRDFSGSSQPARLLTSVVSSLTCAGVVIVLVDFSVPLLLATFLALLAGVQTRYIEASVNPTPHTWYMLFAFACLFFFARFLMTKKDRELYYATVAFSLAFELGVADHFRLSNYISEFLLYLIATAGLLFVDLERAFLPSALNRHILLSAFCAILAVGCFTEWHQRPDAMQFRPWLSPLLSGIRDNVPPGRTILVTDDWEALWLYLPGYRFEPTITKNSSEPRSKLRAAQASYFLFDGSVPPPTGSSAIAVFSTYPGHTEVLWRPGIESAKAP